MTYDHDVLMDLPIHLFYTMQNRVIKIQREVRQLKEDMKGWGFDGRNPLKSDSFTIPKLIQFDAVFLTYIVSFIFSAVIPSPSSITLYEFIPVCAIDIEFLILLDIIQCQIDGAILFVSEYEILIHVLECPR